MKFLCDDNLGKLARYLRMLGVDTFFQSEISDAQLLSVMLKQDRIVLTRDTQLIGRIEEERCLFIESDSPEEQLKQVIEGFEMTFNKANLFTRCLECNKLCENVSKEEISDKIFPYVLKTQESFQRCPSCKRIYWQGSHYKEMWEKLRAIVKFPET